MEGLGGEKKYIYEDAPLRFPNPYRLKKYIIYLLLAKIIL